MSVATPKALSACLCGFLVLFLGLVGCGSDDKPTGPGTREVETYLSSLPSWSEFSPLRDETDPIPVGTPVTSGDTLDVTQYNEDGSTEVIPNVRFTCTETEYSITKNPAKFVMVGGPSIDMLWPGALVQGGGLRSLGDLLPLTIAERTPIRVSIPALPTSDNYRTITPSQSTTASAIGEMIGDATVSELPTPSTISFTMRECNSEKEFALTTGMSARYLGFSASAQGGYIDNASKHTVTVEFYQKMYEVVVEPPQTPGSFFSAEFTKEKLDQQIALGRMGPENVPIYVSRVVYGRMLMFTMTSMASSEEIQAAISAAYDGIGGGGSGSLSARQRTILAEAEFQIASLGGDAQDVLNIIRSGDWSQYFTSDPPLSTAEALCYEFRNLVGSIALVSETTHYTKRVCTAVSSATSFGGYVDEDDNGIPDRFCPQQILGDCDYDGVPMTILDVDYIIDASGIQLLLYMKGWRGTSTAESQWYVRLLQLPQGVSIASVGGLPPDQWRAANHGHREDWGGIHLSGDILLGNTIVRIIGDTGGNDICGPCDQDVDGRSGYWSVLIPQTSVELNLSCCP